MKEPKKKYRLKEQTNRGRRLCSPCFFAANLYTCTTTSTKPILRATRPICYWGHLSFISGTGPGNSTCLLCFPPLPSPIFCYVFFDPFLLFPLLLFLLFFLLFYSNGQSTMSLWRPLDDDSTVFYSLSFHPLPPPSSSPSPSLSILLHLLLPFLFSTLFSTFFPPSTKQHPLFLTDGQRGPACEKQPQVCYSPPLSIKPSPLAVSPTTLTHTFFLFCVSFNIQQRKPQMGKLPS